MQLAFLYISISAIEPPHPFDDPTKRLEHSLYDTAPYSTHSKPPLKEVTTQVQYRIQEGVFQ